MLRMTVTAILLIVITLPVWGLTEARLLNQSSSGQTVLFNLGRQDGIKEGDYAIIVKQIRDLNSHDLRFVPAAKAKNVKMNLDSSVWILYHIYDSELLVKNDKFQVLSESHMLSGRRPIMLGRVTMVNQKDSVTGQTKDALNDDRDRLSKLKDNYQTITPTHANPTVTGNDAELIDVDVWQKNNDLRYRSSLYKSVNKEEWQRQQRLGTFEHLVTAYLKKVNDPDFNYATFMDNQKKSEYAHEFVDNANLQSEYNKFLRKEARKSTADAKLYRSILEKGESWSEEYSDEELKNVLSQVSVMQEKDRRHLVQNKPTRYSVALGYGHEITDAQSDKDPNHKRTSRYSTDIDFEATPFLGHGNLEHVTLNGSFRLNHSAFEAETLNADLDEYSITVGANWYPTYTPYAVESPIFFLGTYFRSGFAKANAPTAGEKADYTVISLPAFRAGFKYLMRNNFGVRALLSLETLRLDRYESDTPNTILPDKKNLLEAKFGVGLAYAF